MTTAVGLVLAVERLERGVKGFIWDGHDNAVIVSNEDSGLLFQNSDDQDDDKRSQSRKQRHTCMRRGFPLSKTKSRLLFPDTLSDILPVLADALDC
jgi:hypothetical protein